LVLAWLPPKVIVHGPPTLPVTPTLSMEFKASSAVSTSLAVVS
jgi:hypothetical protein